MRVILVPVADRPECGVALEYAFEVAEGGGRKPWSACISARIGNRGCRPNRWSNTRGESC